MRVRTQTRRPPPPPHYTPEPEARTDLIHREFPDPSRRERIAETQQRATPFDRHKGSLARNLRGLPKERSIDPVKSFHISPVGEFPLSLVYFPAEARRPRFLPFFPSCAPACCYCRRRQTSVGVGCITDAYSPRASDQTDRFPILAPLTRKRKKEKSGAGWEKPLNYAFAMDGIRLAPPCGDAQYHATGVEDAAAASWRALICMKMVREGIALERVHSTRAPTLV